jgi:hypothetical protein
MTELRPFFSYYGGKWRIARRYPAPTFGRIVEPFAGAAGYATRHPNLEVALYDASPVVVGLWDYLIHVTPAEVMTLPIDIEHVDELGAVPQEARWLVGWWLNTGTASPRLSASTRFRFRPNSHWGANVRQRIASQVGLIRHWTVELSDFADVPVGVDATWFVDPPYVGPDGTHYAASVADYGALGAWCRSLPGQVIVCEQEGANWLPFEPFHVSKANNAHGPDGTCREAIWTNTDRADDDKAGAA